MGASSYVVASTIALALVVIRASKRSKLDAIPTYGSWIGSRLAGFEYLIDGINLIQKGFEKHKSAPFKIAAFDRWLVLVNSREHVEELYRASDDILSLADFMSDRLQIEYTMGPEIHHNPYHVPIVRSRLTRNLDASYPEIKDEITTAFDDVLELQGDAWNSVPALSSVQQIVCRASNRAFVGIPLCRDPDWVDLNIRYTVDINKRTILIALFPDLLKPVITWLFPTIRRSKQRAQKLLGPVVEKRQKDLNEYGNEWAERPDDFLSWLMEEAGEGPESTVESLTNRMLFINVAAIHTTSSSFTHALFYLAANPQYIQPLREEVEGIIEKEGWSKAAIGKMRKVDSFLKECQRLVGHNCVSLQRKALKDYTFADGTFVPKGTAIATFAWSAHHGEASYENPLTFQPFRFARLNEMDGEGANHQFVSTGAEYLPFGHGRQACPGRFFAASELKTMLAHVVVTYDVKLEGNATRPEPLRLVTGLLADPSVKVMFKRRTD